MDILKLPDDVILRVMEMLPYNDLLNFSATCRTTRILVWEPQFWRQFKLSLRRSLDNTHIEDLNPVLDKIGCCIRALNIDAVDMRPDGSVILDQVFDRVTGLHTLDLALRPHTIGGVSHYYRERNTVNVPFGKCQHLQVCQFITIHSEFRHFSSGATQNKARYCSRTNFKRTNQAIDSAVLLLASNTSATVCLVEIETALCRN